MRYWQQRDITERLIAQRAERMGRTACDGPAIVEMIFAALPPSVAIACAQALFDPGDILTLTPTSWFEE